MALIIAALALSAIYSGGMYLFIAYIALFGRQPQLTVSQVENDTFHLGLCFILSIGFLGMLLK